MFRKMNQYFFLSNRKLPQLMLLNLFINAYTFIYINPIHFYTYIYIHICLGKYQVTRPI